MGGVLVVYDVSQRIDYIAHELGVDFSAVERAYLHYRDDLEMGKLTNQAFWQGVVVELGINIDADSTAHLWSDNYTQIPIDVAMLELVKTLKQAGYKLGMLSNIDPEHGELNRQRGLFKDFDVALFSDRLGYRKPDPMAYLALCDGLEVAPMELIFIDDLAINIDGAEAAGIKGIHFEGFHSLVERLRQLGLQF